MLDLTSYARTPTDLYSHSEIFPILDSLEHVQATLRGLTISVDDASPDVLDAITRQFESLEGLHLVGNAYEGFIPTPGLYARDVTENIVGLLPFYLCIDIF